MAVDAQFYSENHHGWSPQDWPVIDTVSALGGVSDDFHFNNTNHTQISQFYHHQTTQNHLQVLPSSSSMAFSQCLASDLNLQMQEIDFFLQSQNESLRVVLQDQNKQQLAMYLNNLELKVMNIMRQKEEEIAVATNKSMELQNCLREAEMEGQTWQRIANANEAMIIQLNNTINQVREKLYLETNHGIELDDAESFCGAEKRSERSMASCCKHCNDRNACMLLLPCKHVCLCKSCEARFGFCPVCESVKESCLEIFLA